MIIYRMDESNFFSGETAVIDEHGRCPKGWTRTAPPGCPTGQYARWIDGWVCSTYSPAISELEIKAVSASRSATESLSTVYLVNSARNTIHTQNVIAQIALRGQI